MGTRPGLPSVGESDQPPQASHDGTDGPTRARAATAVLSGDPTGPPHAPMSALYLRPSASLRRSSQSPLSVSGQEFLPSRGQRVAHLAANTQRTDKRQARAALGVLGITHSRPGALSCRTGTGLLSAGGPARRQAVGCGWHVPLPGAVDAIRGCTLGWFGPGGWGRHAAMGDWLG